MSIWGLTSGYYSVSITDSHGCDVYGSSYVPQPAQLLATATTVSASCPNISNGSINLTVSGGISPYTYMWSNGVTLEDPSGLATGSYSVTVTDYNGCVKSAAFTVGVVSAVCPVLTVTGNVTTTVCYNATQVITVAGGTSTFAVQSGGRATFIAGQKISYLVGTRVYSGGYMRGYIAPAGPFCSAKSLVDSGEPPVVNEPQAEIGNGWFSLYPNPTNGNFTVIQKGDKSFGNVKVEIFSMSGQQVRTENMIGLKKHEFRFADMPDGLYFVKVIADDHVETIKLVKTR